jgi:hypothetical protein
MYVNYEKCICAYILYECVCMNHCSFGDYELLCCCVVIIII